jgi:GWxTD domain-containing protein
MAAAFHYTWHDSQQTGGFMNLRRVAIVASIVVAAYAFAGRAQQQQQNPSSLTWGDSPQGYLLTPEERLQWNIIISEEQANAFITNYWAKHGPAFRAEVMKRIAAADKFFPLADKRGSATERGRVFIILGSPNQQQSNRSDTLGRSGGGSGLLNSLEQGAIVGVIWTYKPDRLPKDLGVSELVVSFQTDVSRGYETIVNPGLVEPYLKRAINHFVANFKTPDIATAPPTPAKVKAAFAAAPVPPDDAVWAAESALNGAIVTGDSYVSPTGKPFYAVDFYLPQSAFASLGDVVVAGVIRDGSGKQVASVRRPAKAAQYDANGDRFVDTSFELPAGRYTGAFALATADGKLLASSKHNFDVMPAEHVGISKVLMTSRIDTLPNQQVFDPFTFVAMKYNVKGDRRFRTTDRIAYFTVLSNPTANPTPSVMVKMKMTKDGKPFDSWPMQPVELTQTGPHTYLVANQFDAGAFPAGHYALEVTVRDANADKASDAYKGTLLKSEFDVTP